MRKIDLQAEFAQGCRRTPEPGFALAAVGAGFGVGADQFVAAGAEDRGHRLDSQVFVDFGLVGAGPVVAYGIDGECSAGYLGFHQGVG